VGFALTGIYIKIFFSKPGAASEKLKALPSTKFIHLVTHPFNFSNFSIQGQKDSEVFKKKMFISARKYDPGCSSRIRIFPPSRIRIPDPGVKKISGSRVWNKSFVRQFAKILVARLSLSFSGFLEWMRGRGGGASLPASWEIWRSRPAPPLSGGALSQQ
jgi:hypothetical protein